MINNTSNVRIIYDRDTPINGSRIHLNCPPGLVLNGPSTYTSICMENGEWEPNPRKVKCDGNTLG